jgi:hypothetical protein
MATAPDLGAFGWPEFDVVSAAYEAVFKRPGDFSANLAHNNIP